MVSVLILVVCVLFSDCTAEPSQGSVEEVNGQGSVEEVSNRGLNPLV